jgi:hypothetical protein|nr:zf-HC2 domain-containing protein [Candidatus Krumholzibacteria bacterium]
MVGSEEHIWVRQHLIAAAAGLLEGPDDERLHDHLKSCPDCARQWQEQIETLAGHQGEGDPEGERHIPAAMIARWDQVARDLRGVERQAVRGHLERCGTCREELKSLGFPPVLSAVPSARNRTRSSRSFRAGLNWGVGVTAIAAMMAWWLILPEPSAEKSELLPWVAPVTLRSGGPQTLELPADATAFSLLATVPSELDQGSSAKVQVVDPQGNILLDTLAVPQQLEGRTLSMVIRVGDLVYPGPYRVVFSQMVGEGSVRTWESAFLIHRAEP